MRNAILDSWFEREFSAAQRLAEQSDLLELEMHPNASLRAVLAHFTCKGLVRCADGRITPAANFVVGVRIPADYLQRASTFEILGWLSPLEIWHPNISPPHICIGFLAPGMSLVDILYQLFEIITYNKVSPDDPINEHAAVWARTPEARRQFPVDSRPLKRSVLPARAGVFTTPAAAREDQA